MHSHTNIARITLLALLCILSLCATACGDTTGHSSSASTFVKAGLDKQVYIDPVRFGGLKTLRTLDPALAIDSASITAIDMVFTGLVSLDDKLAVRDQLAASHSLSQDGLTYTFTLKSGLTFSDGTPLTSSDVAYSLDRALDPALKSNASPTYLGLIKDAGKRLKGQVKTLVGDSLLIPDPQTIKIVLSHKAAYFLQALTYPCAYVVEKSAIDKYGNTDFTSHLVDGIGGAGPFVVATYTPGKAIEFVPNKRYYGPQPQLRKVVFPFFPSIDAEFGAYKANQLDVTQITSSEIGEAQAMPDHQYLTIPQLVITYVTFNYLVKPFDNIHIRQAFALALNKDTLAYTISRGLVIPTNHIVPQGMPGYAPNLTNPAGAKSTTGDVEKAKQLLQQGLQEEGMSSMPPVTFFVATNGNSTNRDQVTSMQAMWKAIGINVTITDLNLLALLTKVHASLNNPKGLAMWRLNWVGDYADPQNWLTLQFGTGSLGNQLNYGQNHAKNAGQQLATQQLMTLADANPDQSSRMQQYNQAEQQLVNDVAWLPISQAVLPYAVKPCVVGRVYNAAWLTPPDDWANVYISTNPLCANTSMY